MMNSQYQQYVHNAVVASLLFFFAVFIVANLTSTSNYCTEALQLPSDFQSRRSALKKSLKWIVIPAGASIPRNSPALATNYNDVNNNSKQEIQQQFTVYQVIPDATEALSPTIKQIQVRKQYIILE